MCGIPVLEASALKSFLSDSKNKHSVACAEAAQPRCTLLVQAERRQLLLSQQTSPRGEANREGKIWDWENKSVKELQQK